MKTLFGKRALFVTNSYHLSNHPGGVQTCSREYLALLTAAGLDVRIINVEVDRRLPIKIRRRFRNSPYVGPISISDFNNIADAVPDNDIIFFNQVNLAGALAYDCRGASIASRTVLLSHGSEVTDFLNGARAPKRFGIKQRRPSMRTVTRVLRDEVASRRYIAGSVCLTSFDADFERWLGVKRTTWIPRTVNSKALDWAPIAGRFGFLGTLNHPPNFEGLLDILDIMDVKDLANISIRIIGAPEQLGRWLQHRYKVVSYLGQLDDDAVKREAATWSAFLNPVFCQARGCSTKLATGLGWEIPIITTTIGRRGYVQHDGSLAIADDAKSFVQLMSDFLEPVVRDYYRHSTIAFARSTPPMEENAVSLSKFLTPIICDI